MDRSPHPLHHGRTQPHRRVAACPAGDRAPGSHEAGGRRRGRRHRRGGPGLDPALVRLRPSRRGRGARRARGPRQPRRSARHDPHGARDVGAGGRSDGDHVRLRGLPPRSHAPDAPGRHAAGQSGQHAGRAPAQGCRRTARSSAPRSPATGHAHCHRARDDVRHESPRARIARLPLRQLGQHLPHRQGWRELPVRVPDPSPTTRPVSTGTTRTCTAR